MTAEHRPHSNPARPARRRRRPRPMAAGHAVLAVLVALGSGTVLNAESLMKTAESLPLGSTKRSIAVGVMRPVRWISSHVLLTWPRDRVDTALGKASTEVEDPFEVFTTSSSAASNTSLASGTTAVPVTDGSTPPASDGTTTSTPPTTAPEPRRPTADNPLRVYVAGDSLSAMYGIAMGRLAQDDPELEMTGEVDYRVSSGLARPDNYNWPAQLDAQMKARNPEVVIFMVGSNDDQPISSPDGQTHQTFTDGWKAEYARRVGAVMDQVIATRRVIVYVGIPVIRDAARSQGYQVINQIVYQEARRRADAWFIDSFKLFADANGGYQQYLPDDSGQLVKLRVNDGIHFERAGGDRLARRTLQLLDKIFPPAP